MRFRLKTGLAVAVLSVAAATQAQAQMRFQGMDRNHDGVITRDEWRGSDKSFRNQDWNGDNVLSGDEVRPGARKPPTSDARRDWNNDGVVDNQDVLINQRFHAYDRNGDGRITIDEWRAASADSALFYRLDTDHNRSLTLAEYGTMNGVAAQGGPRFQFPDLDRNRDGWITRNEWNMGNAEFDRLDTNRDNRISRFEFQNYSGSYSTVNPGPQRTGAAQSGYDRGLSEGRQAGREDRANGHGWDLDGQTELEGADSGYYPQLGRLGDYQSGYREGFRIGYREGFNN
jgi:hypothetical protein